MNTKLHKLAVLSNLHREGVSTVLKLSEESGKEELDILAELFRIGFDGYYLKHSNLPLDTDRILTEYKKDIEDFVQQNYHRVIQEIAFVRTALEFIELTWLHRIFKTNEIEVIAIMNLIIRDLYKRVSLDGI